MGDSEAGGVDGAEEEQTPVKLEGKPLPIYATKFSEEVLKAEERRPKRKVAVLIGYSGTGYKGMQLSVSGFAKEKKSFADIPC